MKFDNDIIHSKGYLKVHPRIADDGLDLHKIS